VNTVEPIIPQNPNDQWHMDFKGPITTPENYTFYILVLIDSFTKFLWTKVFEFKDCEPVALWTKDQIIKEGPPKRMTTDNGGEFVNEVMDYIEKTLGLNKGITSTFYMNTTLKFT
jgi:hypothetical protein